MCILNVYVKDDLKPNSSWELPSALPRQCDYKHHVTMTTSTWLPVFEKEREDINNVLHVYRMAGNFCHFRGWLGSHKNSTHEWIDDGRNQNIMVEWPVLASNSSHCHPANSIHFYLCYLSKSVCRCGLKSWAKSSICIDYIIVYLAPQPWIGLLSWIKINSEGLSDFPQKLPTIWYRSSLKSYFIPKILLHIQVTQSIL